MDNEYETALEKMEKRFERRGYNEKQKELFRSIFKFRAELYSNPELCLERMKERKVILDYIPREWWQDIEFCREAVKAWDDALEYVPEVYLKYGIVEAASEPV